MAFENLVFTSDRFEIIDRLGSGGFGVVYAAFDRQTRAKVALKTLHRLKPDALLRFKREFRALREVQHENLVRLGELIEERGRWFFTMELIEGRDVLAAVREAPDPLARLRSVIEQLAAGLIALHAAGRVHRDIKPSNILVTDGGRVVIVDFGIVFGVPSGVRLTTGARILGSPAYMAPEQAGTTPVGPPADWYSVGVLLYEALTGKRPFEGSRSDVLLRKLAADPVPPRAIVPEIPEDLDELCLKLLARAPAARPTGPEVRQALAQKRAVRGERVPELGSPRFVGREGDLSLLAEALRDSRERFVAVSVEGGPGIGKSALLAAFAERLVARDPRPYVLAARGSDRESVPFRAVDAAVDALAQYLRRIDPRELPALIPPGMEALARTFAVLRDFGGGDEVDDEGDRLPLAAGPPERRGQIVGAVRALLAGLSARAPVLLSIDELQWADEDSLELLRELARPPEAPRIMLLTAERDAPAPLLANARRVRLEAMPAAEAGQLAGQLLERHGHGRRGAAAIATAAGGHPLLIDLLAAGGPNLRQALRAAESRLEPKAHRLLQLVAVGAPLAVEAAAHALGAGTEEARRLADVLIFSRLVCSTRSSGRPALAPSHAAVAGALGGRPAAEEHRLLAAALEATGGDAEAIRAHREAAGDRAAAARRLAGEAARAAPDRAAALFGLAVRVAPEEMLPPMRVALADALLASGRADEGAALLLAAAEDHPAALALRRRAADALAGAGRLGEAAAALERAVATASIAPAPSRLALLLARFRRPPPEAIEACRALGLVALLHEDVDRGLRLLRLAALLRGGPPPPVPFADPAAAGAASGIEATLWEAAALGSLSFRGDLRELSSRVTAAPDPLRRRLLGTGRGALHWLSRGQPEQVPRHRGPALLGWLDLLARGELALYLGDAGAILDELAAAPPPLGMLRTDLLHLRARAALQAGRLAEASAAARRLGGQATPLGNLIAAGVANRQGDAAGALRLLADVERCDLPLFAAAARRARGKLSGDVALVASAEQALPAADPARFASLLAPGFQD